MIPPATHLEKDLIHHLPGDLWDSAEAVIAHGCNNRGRMGAGFAQTVRERFPDLYEDYRKRCRRGDFELGSAYVFQTKDGPAIINIATQSRGGASLSALEAGFRNLLRLCAENGITEVAMPRIGAGLGGLDWAQVEPLLLDALQGHAVSVRVYTTENRARV